MVRELKERTGKSQNTRWMLKQSFARFDAACFSRPFEHPLSQFPLIPFEIIQKLNQQRASLDRLREMSAQEIGASRFRPPRAAGGGDDPKRHPGLVTHCCPYAAGDLVRHQRMGKVILGYVEQFPRLHMEANVQPISR